MPLRRSTAQPLGLALATLTLSATALLLTGCGSSSSQTQVRFVNAIQDAGALDVQVSNPSDTGSVPMQYFTDVSFLGVQPAPGYTAVPAGSDTFIGLDTGTSTQVFSDTTSVSTGTSYTVVTTGFSKTGNNGSNVVLLPFADDNSSPPSGDVGFRVIHASPSGVSPVDIYILLNPNTVPLGTPAISGLAYQSASNYVAVVYNPNDVTPAPGFTVYVTPAGSLQPIFSQPINPEQAGAVRTLILTDVQNGNAMRQAFLELDDLD